MKIGSHFYFKPATTSLAVEATNFLCMKKLLILAVTFTLSAGVFAQDNMDKKMDHKMDEKMDKKMMMKDGVMMKDGKMMMMKDGETMMMDKDIEMSNGTMVMMDGTVKMKDGKTMMMKDGDQMSMNGKMGKMKMNKSMQHKM